MTSAMGAVQLLPAGGGRLPVEAPEQYNQQTARALRERGIANG